MENEFRTEIIEAIKHRQTLDLAKISFVTALLGLGSIQVNQNVLYLAPLVAIFFDMLIMGQTYSIRRLGAFLRIHSSNPIEKEYENYVSQHRDNFFKFGSLAITVISLVTAVTLLLVVRNQSIIDLYTTGEIGWFVFVLALFFIVLLLGNSRIKEFERIQKTIQATVAAIVFRETEKEVKVVLTRRVISPFKGQWCLPGGHIDGDETAQEAIVREVEEETGLKYKAKFFNYFDEIIPIIHHHNLVIVFTGIGEGEFSPQVEEVAEIKWFSISEALGLDLAFEHAKILRSYFEK